MKTFGENVELLLYADSSGQLCEARPYLEEALLDVSTLDFLLS